MVKKTMMFDRRSTGPKHGASSVHSLPLRFASGLVSSLAAAAFVVVAVAAPAFAPVRAAVSAAQTVLLDFEGVGNDVFVGDYYGGGGGGLDKDYGIVFGPDMLAAVDTDAGGSVNIANEPSPSTVVISAHSGIAGK